MLGFPRGTVKEQEEEPLDIATRYVLHRISLQQATRTLQIPYNSTRQQLHPLPSAQRSFIPCVALFLPSVPSFKAVFLVAPE